MAGKHAFRRFFVNMVCGLVPAKHRRRRIRVILDTPFISICRFIKKDCGIKHPRLKITIGSRGKNLVINVSNKYVYKFRVTIDDFDDSLERREYDITSALAKISPIRIVVPKIIKYSHGIARRYDFISGVSFSDIVKSKHYGSMRGVLINELANFIYAVSCSDPKNIRKYKKNPNQKPGYMLGWYHVDLFENFLINESTFHINGVIDWEDVDFRQFEINRKRRKTPLFEKFMSDVQTEYDAIYRNSI